MTDRDKLSVTAHMSTTGQTQHNAAPLLACLASINEASAVHLRVNEISLERCRLAAEWRKTVQEQGVILLDAISRRAVDIDQKLREHGNLQAAGLNVQSTDHVADSVLRLEKQKERLRTDISAMRDAHKQLDECMVRLVTVLEDVESASAGVMACAERVRSNELVSYVGSLNR